MRLTCLLIAGLLGSVMFLPNSPALAAGGAAGDGEVSSPSIPKDARWTIYCSTIATDDHLAQARTLQKYLVQNTQLRDWYLVQGDGQTTLYYGFYREISDEKDKREADRAHAAVKAIAALSNPNTGARMFNGVFLMTLEAADPVAPPEWNLVRAKGYYTLQVGVYKDSPQRKDAAVQAVRDARAAGHEAYFYHGPSSSSVCIGAWPQEAVRKEAEATATNPNAVPMLVPESMAVPQGMTTADGKAVESLKSKIEIVDPTLLEAMKKFPVHAVNGLYSRKMRNPQTGVVRTLTEPSVLVVIPRKGEAATANASAPVYVPPPPANLQPDADKPTPPADPWRAPPRPLPASKGGKLKSLED